MTEETATLLKTLAQRYETRDFIDGDPSWYMHQMHDDANREAMAFLASCFSYGSRKQFMSKLDLILSWAQHDICNWIASGAYEHHFAIDDNSSFYRLNSHGSVRVFLDSYRLLMDHYGSLGAYVRQHACDGISAIGAITAYFDKHGSGGLVPKNTQSACKRICMFLRWMVRHSSPVDLGLWSAFVDRRTLIMPLDTHVLSQSVALGLLSCSSASMAAACRLTASMREVFPDDPLLGDFALFGYGIANKYNNYNVLI